MTNKRLKILLPVLMLAFGMALLASCASKQYMVLDEPLTPDSRSAVVYFYDIFSTEAEIWDGEKAVGIFAGLPMSKGGCLQWKTTPGAHTFVARRSNNTHLRMNLQANRIYYVEIINTFSPYATIIVMKEVDAEREDQILNRYRIEDITFSDEWRENFATADNGKKLNEVRAYLAGIK